MKKFVLAALAACAVMLLCGGAFAAEMDSCVKCWAEAVVCVDYGLYHVGTCSECGYIQESARQWVRCDENVCVYCGNTANLTGARVEHVGSMQPYDEKEHRWTCVCGKGASFREKHYAACDGPADVCAACGTEASGMRVRHEYTAYEAAPGGHYAKCALCGQLDSHLYEHESYCTNPFVCEACGARDPNMPVDHVFSVYDDLGDTHLTYCVLCRQDVEEPHYASCTWPDECAVCYASVEPNAIIVQHGAKRNAVITAERHSFDCRDCGKHVDGAHLDWNGMCIICGFASPVVEEPTILPGDVNGDGHIGVYDALAVLQFATGWTGDLDQEAGDVNDDGVCDIYDAVLILQYSVGWDVELK